MTGDPVAKRREGEPDPAWSHLLVGPNRGINSEQVKWILGLENDDLLALFRQGKLPEPFIKGRTPRSCRWGRDAILAYLKSGGVQRSQEELRSAWQAGEDANEAERSRRAANITRAMMERALPSERLLRCGVYFLLRRGVVVYVGQSVHVLRRLSQHEFEGDKEFDGFAFVDVPESMLFSEERYFIEILKPEYNYQTRPVR